MHCRIKPPSAAPTPIEGAKEKETSSKTLYDLCDKSYIRSTSKCDKRKRPVETSEAVSKSDNSQKVHTRELQPSRKKTSEDVRRTAPQVEIVNGQIVVKESSLVMPEDHFFPDTEYEEVNEGAYPTAMYSSFVNRPHSAAWGIEETRRFYQALQQCGTDFSLMQAFFPGRTRRHLKLKFFREEKQYPELIRAVLESKCPLELSAFEAHFGVPSTEITKNNDISLDNPDLTGTEQALETSQALDPDLIEV